MDTAELGGSWRFWLRAVFAIMLAVTVAACTERRAVTPESFDTFLKSGDHDEFTLKVNLTDLLPSFVQLDIVFLLDATGSMGNIIDTMRQNAVSIIQQIRKVNPNTAFGVASFGDYGSTDPVWTLDQDITQNATGVVSALGRIRMLDGGDLPEAYSRALYEMQFLSWRPGARRYVILFGDAPAHDPDFFGKNFGVDPGRDAIPGTADDLRFRDVVQQLVTSKITVIGIYDRGPWYGRKELGAETKMGFEFVAKETGGIAVPITSADEVPNILRQGFTKVRPPVPVVKVSERFAEWLTISAPESADTKGRYYRFAVSILPPSGTASGVYDIPLRVMAGDTTDAGEIGRSTVRVRIGWLHYEWRWLLFAALLLLLVILTLLNAMRKRHLLPAGSRMLGARGELGLLWRGALVLLIVVLLASIVLVLPETPAELLAHS